MEFGKLHDGFLKLQIQYNCHGYTHLCGLECANMGLSQIPSGRGRRLIGENNMNSVCKTPIPQIHHRN